MQRPGLFVVLAICDSCCAEGSDFDSGHGECRGQDRYNGKTDRSHLETRGRLMCVMHNGLLMKKLSFSEPLAEMSVFMQTQESLRAYVQLTLLI